MRRAFIAGVVLVASVLTPLAALAQRVPFERKFDAAGTTGIDVANQRGKIEIVAGPPGTLLVEGTVTVRIGVDVPANAIELARQVAAAPPVELAGGTLHLHDPIDHTQQRAVTVSYKVTMPADLNVQTVSDSGETTVHGIAGPVSVRTHTGAVRVGALAGAVTLTTGSGALAAEAIKGSLTLRTQSGNVEATMAGDGDVDVQTGSSQIRLDNLRGGLLAKTQSGRIILQGAPGRPWTMTASSSAVEFTLAKGAGFDLDAVTRSGSIVLPGTPVQGSVSKRAVKGTVFGGGPLVRIVCGSGSIRIMSVDK